MKNNNFFVYIRGYNNVYCPNGTALIDYLIKNNIKSWSARSDGCGIFLKISKIDCAKICNDENAPVIDIKNEKGIPQLINRYHFRIGIILGIIIFSSILFLSSLYIWDVRISGNEKIEKNIIEERLRGLGCHSGAFIPDINFYDLCNKYLLDFDDTSWITVNIKGNVAYVELHEMIINEKQNKNTKTANIIASRDGIIERLEVFSGTPAIHAGDSVKAGQLLISGIMESKPFGWRAIRAEGRVIAKTSKLIEVTVPYMSVKKVSNEQTYTKRYLKIFGNKINLLSGGSNFDGLYDIIETENDIVLFGIIKLPAKILSLKHEGYILEEYKLNDYEACEIAEKKLNEQILAELYEADIISRTEEVIITEEFYKIVCEIIFMSDISEISEFDIK